MHDVVYRVVIVALRILFRVLGVRPTVLGAENVPVSGPAVLAANHIGFLDFAFVGLGARPSGRLVRFMAKRSTFDSPLSGPAMRAMGHIRADRRHGAVAYRIAARKLDAGEVVGMFPEATISRAWTLKPFKLGAATLAVDRQVPLIPVITWGGHRLLTVDGQRTLRRGLAVTVLIGEPIVLGPDSSPAEADAELQWRMQTMLDTAQHDYPDSPASADDRWWLPRHLGGTAPDPVTAAPIDEAAALADDLAVPRRRHRFGGS